MNSILGKKQKNIIRIICAALLFIAVFNLPIEYYSFLRLVVFIGAIVMIMDNLKNPPWLLIFILIAFLFNPIIPVYLLNKLYWIPIDIISGVFFLLPMIPNNEKKTDKNLDSKKAKNYNRDKIY